MQKHKTASQIFDKPSEVWIEAVKDDIAPCDIAKKESIEFINWTVETLYHSCTDLKTFWWEHSSSEKQYTTEQLYELYLQSKK